MFDICYNTKNGEYMTIKKPLLAEDADINKIKFPVMVQCKIDGVRAIYLEKFSGRSLKGFPNKFTFNKYNDPIFKGFDGELIVGSNPVEDDLCNKCTSAFNSHEGEPESTWYIFDYITDETKDLPYVDRFEIAFNRVIELQKHGYNIKLIPHELICNNLEELLEFETMVLELGFEGICIRKLDGKYKQGRSTINSGELLRIKRQADLDAIIVSIIEAKSNKNEAKINELGLTERSSHMDNLVPKGMVASFICIDKISEKQITVGAGKLKHNDRILIWENKNQYIGKTLKYRCFKYNEKDLPRFPRWIAWREDFDIGE
jgi:DNA ligase-1